MLLLLLLLLQHMKLVVMDLREVADDVVVVLLLLLEVELLRRVVDGHVLRVLQRVLGGRLVVIDDAGILNGTHDRLRLNRGKNLCH